MTVTFSDLVRECEAGDARMLADSVVELSYGSLYRRVTVQRADGLVWEAFDAALDDRAERWSIPKMQYLLLHEVQMLGHESSLDGDWLYDSVSELMRVDRVNAAIEQAEAIISEAR